MGDASYETLAWFELQEGVRLEAEYALSALHEAGVSVQLLSGDSLGAVAKVAKQLRIQQFMAECSPQTKLNAIQDLQQLGHRVGMVGDGLNDGPVLAGADVSFAFGRAVPLAQASSDFVVLSDNLELVAQTVELSRKTLRVVRQNLIGSALYNAVSIPLAMMGLMPAWLAGLGMALSSLLVVINAARLARPLSLRSAKECAMPSLKVPKVAVHSA